MADWWVHVLVIGGALTVIAIFVAWTWKKRSPRGPYEGRRRKGGGRRG